MKIFSKEILAVLFGGALGAVLRFILSRGINALLPKNFPWGIWAVNIVGCLVIGVIAAYYVQRDVGQVFWRTFWMIGLLGGFTTFSSFSLDTMTLLHNAQVLQAFLYVFSSVLISISATFLGYIIASAIIV